MRLPLHQTGQCSRTVCHLNEREKLDPLDIVGCTNLAPAFASKSRPEPIVNGNFRSVVVVVVVCFQAVHSNCASGLIQFPCIHRMPFRAYPGGSACRSRSFQCSGVPPRGAGVPFVLRDRRVLSHASGCSYGAHI